MKTIERRPPESKPKRGVRQIAESVASWVKRGWAKLGAPDASPWTFVPLLYFMQALPVTLVQEMSSIVYKSLGVDNVAITSWTSLIALPWTIKLLWGPLVDVNSTKRRWVLGMQAFIAVAIAGVAFCLRLPNWFGISLGLLFIIAIFSATCDIATDGFYILCLNKGRQAAYVGLTSTFYRLGRLFCTGLLVWVAGKLRESGMPAITAWSVVLLGLGVVYGAGRLINGFVVPKPAADTPPAKVPAKENWLNIGRTLSVVAFAICAVFALSSATRLAGHGLFLTLDQKAVFGQTLYLWGWELPASGVFLVNFPGLKLLPTSGVEVHLLRIVAFGAVSALLLWAVRRLMSNTPMGEAFGSFFRQSGIVPILAFIMFYRFGEAMVVKMAPLFLMDPASKGGMGLGESEVGLVNGVAGVLGIVIGGIVGGLFVSRLGIRKSLWPLVICMHTPNLLYLWAAVTRPHLALLYGVAFVDQFGYGFGFAGYMVYLMWVAQRGKFKTSHYAIGTGLGALCIMTAGILSGLVQKQFGYVGFFIAVIFLTLPGMATLFFIPLDRTTGKGSAPAEVG